ncbi:uncharacterized protein C8Q71DRAFT_862647 [Rhodofomes roseus]|uniref:Uncharacterized protein n=1 Tax=Rhodofomes roseus TaxID=34475 RepID=A0ABQ8K101_9APHY|nr:uncharacterized protein C8Q71DRAFT_862647 [Rhodofomes roseus]KAH9830356.1 hypothetical protein C8Q71DRAFT_862647 [Rhodofomes roseus]
MPVTHPGPRVAHSVPYDLPFEVLVHVCAIWHLLGACRSSVVLTRVWLIGLARWSSAAWLLELETRSSSAGLHPGFCMPPLLKHLLASLNRPLAVLPRSAVPCPSSRGSQTARGATLLHPLAPLLREVTYILSILTMCALALAQLPARPVPRARRKGRLMHKHLSLCWHWYDPSDAAELCRPLLGLRVRTSLRRTSLSSFVNPFLAICALQHAPQPRHGQDDVSEHNIGITWLQTYGHGSRASVGSRDGMLRMWTDE